MTLPDVNLLLYANDATSPYYPRSKIWLETTLGSEETLAIAWAFLRLSTNAKIFAQPLSFVEAIKIMESLIARRKVVLVQPGEKHFRILTDLFRAHPANANDVADFHLAAIALERDCVLASHDQGFARFKSLRWVDPLR